MVLIGFTMVLLAKLTMAQVGGPVQAWYADDATMAGKLRMIAVTVCIIIEKEIERGHCMETEKSLHICKDSVIEANLKVLG